MRRKDFLIGLGGFAAGAPLGALGGRHLSVDTGAQPDGNVSYAQSGEDLVVNFLCENLNVREITYLDIGAYDPVYLNNTYFFYRRGHRGVLVEPNVTMCEKLRAVRPGDTVLEAGIGIGKTGEADYYVMSNPSWSTFDRAEAEHQVKATAGKITIKEVRRMPLLDVNEVMARHFKGKAPAYVSIDAEGWHFAILKSIDFARMRPRVICVETKVSGERRMLPEIPALMEKTGYVARGGSYVNTVFVDSALL
jgi:methyltransferase FkbM-like protein